MVLLEGCIYKSRQNYANFLGKTNFSGGKRRKELPKRTMNAENRGISGEFVFFVRTFDNTTSAGVLGERPYILGYRGVSELREEN